jgi:hypothetical protein
VSSQEALGSMELVYLVKKQFTYSVTHWFPKCGAYSTGRARDILGKFVW